MSGPTPTPWLLTPSGKTVYALDETGSTNRFSLLVNGGWLDNGLAFTPPAELTANAALIVKAVNAYQPMLEALEAWHTYDSRDDSGPNAGVQMMLDYAHALTLTRAAIALAKGETL